MFNVYTPKHRLTNYIDDNSFLKHLSAPLEQKAQDVFQRYFLTVLRISRPSANECIWYLNLYLTGRLGMVHIRIVQSYDICWDWSKSTACVRIIWGIELHTCRGEGRRGGGGRGCRDDCIRGSLSFTTNCLRELKKIGKAVALENILFRKFGQS
jgi:hypothetical protein